MFIYIYIYIFGILKDFAIFMKKIGDSWAFFKSKSTNAETFKVCKLSLYPKRQHCAT